MSLSKTRVCIAIVHQQKVAWVAFINQICKNQIYYIPTCFDGDYWGKFPLTSVQKVTADTALQRLVWDGAPTQTGNLSPPLNHIQTAFNMKQTVKKRSV